MSSRAARVDHHARPAPRRRARRSCRRRPCRRRSRRRPRRRRCGRARAGTRARCAASPPRARPSSTSTRASTRPAGRVEPHDGLRLGHLDHAGLDQHGGHADRPVAAHRQAARDLDEQHAPVGVRRASAAAGSPPTSRCARAARASAAAAGRPLLPRSAACARASSRPGSAPTPPVTTRVGIPSVWESTARRYARRPHARVRRAQGAHERASSARARSASSSARRGGAARPAGEPDGVHARP